MNHKGRFWFANQYVASTCTQADFTGLSFTCNSTRTLATNWATRITEVQLVLVE